MTRAVVFAYHNVGVRCLKVLLAHGVDITLVVTHADDPRETHWFDSVAATAADYGIAIAMPEDPNARDSVAQVAALRARFPVLVLLPEDAGRAASGLADAWRAQPAWIAPAPVSRTRARQLGGPRGRARNGRNLALHDDEAG